MTKLRTLVPREPADPLKGILKYYAAGSLLALLLVGGLTYWVLIGPH